MTTPKEMRAKFREDLVRILNDNGFSADLYDSSQSLLDTARLALTHYGKVGTPEDGLHPTTPEHHDLKLTKVGHLGYIIWRCAAGLGFTGSEGLNEISDLILAAIDERVAKALSEKETDK